MAVCRLKQIMISQPMNGLTDEEVLDKKNKITNELSIKGYHVIDTFLKDYEAPKGIVHIPVNYLAKSIEFLSYADVLYMCKGWEKARGCVIEHDIAKAYGIEIIYEEAVSKNTGFVLNDVRI